MSLPSFQEVRERIEAIEDLPIKRLFQTVYLFGLRIGEACGYRYPSETKAQPTGMLLWATVANWQLPDEDDDETITLIQRLMYRNYGKKLSDDEVIALVEPAFVLSIITEKREGFNRQVAIPMNPDYEPWAKEVYQYIAERQAKGPLPHLKKLTEKLNGITGKIVSLLEVMKTPEGEKILKTYEPVFPFRRQEVYPMAVKIFHGFTYPITQYNRIKKDETGQPVTEIKDGKEKNIYETQPGHQKKFSSHANRHERSTELKTRYRIKRDLLSSFMGWTKSRSSESSPMEDRYVLEPWKEAGYFPRLLRRRA